MMKMSNLQRQATKLTRLKGSVSAFVIATALVMPAAAQAQYLSWEYATSSPEGPAQPNLAQIGVNSTLHTFVSQNGAGLGSVTIAILDGKVDVTHIDLATFSQDPSGPAKSSVTFIPSYGGRFRNSSQHGTHVAGIAAANLNNAALVGVDPFAKILSIPVFDDRGWIANDLGKAALDAALAGGARVVNMSYGSTTSGAIFLSGELALFATPKYLKQMVLVRSGGNDGVYAKSQTYSAPAGATGNASVDLRNLLIVGSVNANSQISSFSNKPGAACINACGANNENSIRNFWIVAPGENIWSDLPNNYVGTMSGTSMAAPHVTGAAALVFQYALAGGAQISAVDVAEILKFTATDIKADGTVTADTTRSFYGGGGGGDGVDAVYGWGLLNVDKAVHTPLGSVAPPVLGDVTVASSGGGGKRPRRSSRSSLSLSSITQNISGLEGALSGMLVVDGYNRGFIVESPKLSARPSVTTEDPLQRMFGLISATRTELGSDGDYRLSLISGSGQGGNGFSAVSFEGAQVDFEMGRGTSFGYFTSANAAELKGEQSFSRTLGDNFFTGSNAVSTPFNQSLFFGGDYRATPSLTVSALYVQSTPYESLPQVQDNVAAMALEGQSIASLAKFGAQRHLTDGLSVGGSYGLLVENGQTLGARTSGAFSFGDTTLTHMVDANLNARLGENSVLSVFAEQTSTTVGGASGSLFASAETWRGSKYGIAVSRSNIFGGDFLRLKVTRSLQIDDGTMTLNVPVGRDMDGTVHYENRSLQVGANYNPVEVGFAYLRGGNRLSYGAEINVVQDRISSGRISDVSAVGALRWSF